MALLPPLLILTTPPSLPSLPSRALTKSWRDLSEEEELFQCCRVLYIHCSNHRTTLRVDVHNEKCIIILWVYSTIVECDRVIISLAQCAVTTTAYVLLLKAQRGVFVRGKVLIYYTIVGVY